jgi:hypothetical protein
MVAIEREMPRSAMPSSGADGIPAGAKRRTGSPGQVFTACVAGAVVLALLSPPDSPSWTERAGDQPVIAAFREVASEWADHIARFGLTLPHRALRRTVRRFIEMQWR